MPDFLLEIGCEEIPARMLDAAAQELRSRVGDLLERESLLAFPVNDGGKIDAAEAYASPRRLAVLVRGLAAAQPDVTEEILGPSTKVAFKDGQPTPAAEAFARKAGLGIGSLRKVTNAKGEYLAASVTRKGRRAAEILAASLPREIASL